MKSNIEKGEFLTKVEDFTKSMAEMANECEGVVRGLVVLAAEEVEGEDGTKTIISLAGNGQELAELIAELSTDEELEEIFVQGLKLGAIKRFCEKTNDVLDEIKKK